MSRELVEISPDGRLRLHFHSGQWRAWQSDKRFVVMLAGTQGGKTSFGPHWLYREIQRRGPGDYMVVTPTFPLLEVKALPEFCRLFELLLGLGRYIGSPVRRFEFSRDGARRTFGEGTDALDQPTNIFFGYAADPDSLESMTAKAAWCDEAGQKKFRRESLDAILRRLSLSLGRLLITTTPYVLGWLKDLCDQAQQGKRADTEVVRFRSTANPVFPVEEYERARRDMPLWKFNMFYNAAFEQPPGMIYDCFSEALHKVPRFQIPADWPRFLGLDFGGTNTAGLFYAREPGTKRLYLYREYLAGGRTAAEHVQALLRDEPIVPTCVGGSKSEDQWRREFQSGGLPIREPDIKDLWLGIERVYGAHKRGEILVFDDLAGYLDQKRSYGRPLDERGDPIPDQIEDKDTYHFMDAERYIVGWLNRVAAPPPASAVTEDIPDDTYRAERRSRLWPR